MSRNKKIIMISTIAVLIVALIGIGTFALVTVNKSNDKTTTTTKKAETVLSVKKLTNVANTFNLELEAIEDSTKYTYEVTDEAGAVLVNGELAEPKGEFVIPLESLSYNKKLILKSDAYKDDKVIKSLENPYEIIWGEPSISALNNPTINNASNYVINIDGVINENHKIIIKSGDQELLNEVLTGNSFEVPSKLYKNKTITLNISLLSNDVVVSNFVSNNVYVPKTTIKTTTKPKNPISDIVITNPNNYLALASIQDVNVTFTGGDGATSTSIHIYENNNLIKSEVLSAKSYVIPSSMIKKEAGYRVVVEAVNGNFKKSDSVYISTITNGRNKVVELARAQVGNKGDKYWGWWGYNGFVEWCAMFVSWVADQNGYLDAGVIPKFQGVRTGVNWFKERNQFKSRNSGYTPQPGDIIFFDYHPENSLIDHVGIVEYSDGVNVYTIEGNTGKKPNRVCAKKTYPINSSKIYGYGVPNY